MHRTLARLSTLALWLAVALPCAAQGRIAFVRSVYNPEPDPTLRASTLFRVNADGTGFQQLAPMTAGTFRLDPRWSPSGNSLVYVFQQAGTRGQLWRMTATGGNRTRISWGNADHESPAWRPDGGMIAFIARSASGSSCLALVRPDATGQRTLFCPPGSTFFDNRPRWSADGTRLLVATNQRGIGLEPPYYSRAYSVDATTGVATLLTAQTFEDQRSLVIHPSGTHGLYSGQGRIDAVDFATDAVVPRTEGVDPVWSKRGSRFAYTRTDFTDAAIYSHVWLMSADGRSDYEIPMPVADNLGYYPVEFSRDGTRLLTNRLAQGGIAVRLFDIASGRWTRLPEGSASDWWQPAP